MKNDQHILPKVMLLTKQLDPDPRGGREMLCKLNYDALSSLFGDRLVVVQLPFARPSNPREILNTFRGYIDGLSDQIINDTINRIQCENVRHVFVDGSNLGGFVAVLKQYPNMWKSPASSTTSKHVFSGVLSPQSKHLVPWPF